MKYILTSPILIFSYVIMFIVGIIIGQGLSNNFYQFYIEKMSSIAARYILLSIIIFAHYVIYTYFYNYFFLLRKQNPLHFSIYIVFIEMMILTILFTILHIPVFFMNVSLFLKNIVSVIKIIFNIILVSTSAISIIRIIDLKTRKRYFACCLFFVIFSFWDFIFDYFNEINIYFDFNNLLILPIVYKSYWLIALLLIFLIFYCTIKFVSASLRGDYFLDDKDATD